MGFDAIVLAGGPSRRLGGADKALVEVGRRSLLARSLDAVGEAERVIVVGPRRATAARALWTCEDPPGGGPLAAIGAGVALVASPLVVTLAVDLPFVDRRVVEALVDAVGGADGAMIVDPSGRDQFLAAAYRTRSLRAHLEQLGPLEGRSMASLVDKMNVERVATDRANDCDTWAAVAAADRAMRGA